MALAALGTDTGGSIRIPASLCGVVGLKPTYGRVSLRGVIPLSWHLDHAGPLTRTVKDAALVLQTIAGFDPLDPGSCQQPVDDYLSRLEDGINGWHVGIGTGEYVDSADPEVLAAVNAAVEDLRALGAETHAVDTSFLMEAARANGLMTQADGAAYHRERLADHPDWFGEDVRHRLEAGRDLKSADYVLARRVQAKFKRRLEMLLDEYRILILPTTPICAPPISGQDAVECARRLTRFTAPFNLAGLPAISIPCGMSHEGLPIGLQMIAGAWHEAALLRAAYACEGTTRSVRRRPPDV
jgi:aspartyl-tRNA(Asn)/glutamyl-tRNA(Gln) amidotransferase subunit A